jgi:hypothetical protein
VPLLPEQCPLHLSCIIINNINSHNDGKIKDGVANDMEKVMAPAAEVVSYDGYYYHRREWNNPRTTMMMRRMKMMKSCTKMTSTKTGSGNYRVEKELIGHGIVREEQQQQSYRSSENNRHHKKLWKIQKSTTKTITSFQF